MALRGRYELKEDSESMLKILCSESGYEKNSQVCIQYGKYSNRHLLVQYGFAMPNNKYDYYALRLDTAEIYAEKEIPVKTTEKEYVEFKLKRGTLCEPLLSLIRALLFDINSNAIQDFFEKGNSLLDNSVKIRYKALVEKELDSFPTSESEDLQLFAQSHDYKLHFAVTFT